MVQTAEDRGFTLLEIGIALVVLVMAFSIVVPGIQSITGARMRASAGQLGSALRALYAESALSGRTCRMTFDLDARSYWPECARADARISSIQEQSRDGHRYVDEQKEAEEQERLTDLQRDNPLEARLEAKTAFGGFHDTEIKKFVLPDGVEFASVWVQHQSEPYTSGNAYLYFFPQGSSERALVALKHKDDILTLQQSPLTGRVRMIDGPVEVPKP